VALSLQALPVQMGCDIAVQVHKILGPGNQYVTAAKMALQNSEAMISMDMPAGPSEVLVIADAAASAAHVAADLLSQAEHGPDSQVGQCHCPIVPRADIEPSSYLCVLCLFKLSRCWHQPSCTLKRALELKMPFVC